MPDKLYVYRQQRRRVTTRKMRRWPGSGSSTEDIRYAIEAGVIKMIIDTDIQWAFWDGARYVGITTTACQYLI